MYAAPDLPSSDQRTEGELATLTGMLDYYRAVLLRKGAGLTREQLAVTLGPSKLTIGALLKHMAIVEDGWFRVVYVGAERAEPWADVDFDADPDWEFDNAHLDSPEQLHTWLIDSIEASRDAVRTSPDLDRVVVRSSPRPDVNLRWILVHMIEEYARHVGHADLLRESIDGQVDG